MCVQRTSTRPFTANQTNQTVLIYLEMWFHSFALWGSRTSFTMSVEHYTVTSEKLCARLALRILLMIKGTEGLYVYEACCRPVPPSHTWESITQQGARNRKQTAAAYALNCQNTWKVGQATATSRNDCVQTVPMVSIARQALHPNSIFLSNSIFVVYVTANDTSTQVARKTHSHHHPQSQRLQAHPIPHSSPHVSHCYCCSSPPWVRTILTCSISASSVLPYCKAGD